MYYTVCKIVKHNKFTHKTGLKILSESQENQALAKGFVSAFSLNAQCALRMCLA